MSALYDLGLQSSGSAVRVSLEGNAANVLLLDGTNLSNYRSGRTFRYQGGHAVRSPLVLRVPHTDHWYVVIDPGAGRVRAAVQVLTS